MIRAFRLDKSPVGLVSCIASKAVKTGQSFGCCYHLSHVQGLLRLECGVCGGEKNASSRCSHVIFFWIHEKNLQERFVAWVSYCLVMKLCADCTWVLFVGQLMSIHSVQILGIIHRSGHLDWTKGANLSPEHK